MRRSMDELIARSKRDGLADQPFLERLSREPADLEKLHALMSNARGLAANFVPWLASLILRIDDNRIRSFLAKQLDDELGNGDPSRVHIGLYDELLGRLAPRAASLSPSASALSAGRALTLAAERCYRSPDPYEGLGALIVGEIHAEQFNQWFGRELARHKEANPSSLAWYVAHEEAEPNHANDMISLVPLIPEAHLEAACRGGEGIHTALKAFLDAMDRACSRAPREREGAEAGGAVDPAEAFAERYAAVHIDEHPLFRRLRAEPFKASALWLILANLREASAEFVRWLSAITAGVDDDRIRSVLARQLNDELGKGDYDNRHSVLFAKTLEDIAPWRPAQFTPLMLEPGRALRAQLTEYFLSPDAYEGVGASMIGEICAEQFDRLVAEQMRRQHESGPSAWVDAHEELEEGHASDSVRLARLIPAGAASAAAERGADGTLKAFMLFLDKLYAICFA